TLPGIAGFAVSAANQGLWGNRIFLQVTTSSDGNAANFKLIVMYGATQADAQRNIVETYDNVTTTTAGSAPPSNYVRTLVNGRSEYIAITADVTAIPTVPITAMTNGNDGAAATANTFIGAAASTSAVTGTGLRALDKLTDVSLIAIPGQGDPATVNAGMEYC